ncbi:uncharacterized protein VTP21DRAFT_6833 [Calcarisporiella thermophila]|uniref:uncharacterized protein n=1 Tax=Calcarisporiella thermophila TaxID=911321 RepID=UPI003743EAFB
MNLFRREVEQRIVGACLIWGDIHWNHIKWLWADGLAMAFVDQLLRVSFQPLSGYRLNIEAAAHALNGPSSRGKLSWLLSSNQGLLVIEENRLSRCKAPNQSREPEWCNLTRLPLSLQGAAGRLPPVARPASRGPWRGREGYAANRLVNDAPELSDLLTISAGCMRPNVMALLHWSTILPPPAQAEEKTWLYCLMSA